MLSKKSGYQPVRMTLSCAEVLAATVPPSGSFISVKIGVDRARRITAAPAYLAYEAGAFPGSPVNFGMGLIFDLYQILNVLIDGYDVVVNKAKTAAYRAPGGMRAAFSSETIIDELCEKLNLDPLEFRILNGVKEGNRRANGVQLPQIGLREIAQAAQSHPQYTAPMSGPNRGAWCSGRRVGKFRRALQRLGQCELGWHSQPGGRFHRYWQFAHQHCYAAR